MKYIIKLEHDELLSVLGALLNDADRLEILAYGIEDKEASRSFSLKAKEERALYRKILDTYGFVD